jgi:hypothetical protein
LPKSGKKQVNKGVYNMFKHLHFCTQKCIFCRLIIDSISPQGDMKWSDVAFCFMSGASHRYNNLSGLYRHPIYVSHRFPITIIKCTLLGIYKLTFSWHFRFSMINTFIKFFFLPLMHSMHFLCSFTFSLFCYITKKCNSQRLSKNASCIAQVTSHSPREQRTWVRIPLGLKVFEKAYWCCCIIEFICFSFATQIILF